jgi:hypothetical protein
VPKTAPIVMAAAAATTSVPQARVVKAVHPAQVEDELADEQHQLDRVERAHPPDRRGRVRREQKPDHVEDRAELRGERREGAEEQSDRHDQQDPGLGGDRPITGDDAVGEKQRHPGAGQCEKDVGDQRQGPDHAVRRGEQMAEDQL